MCLCLFAFSIQLNRISSWFIQSLTVTVVAMNTAWGGKNCQFFAWFRFALHFQCDANGVRLGFVLWFLVDIRMQKKIIVCVGCPKRH